MALSAAPATAEPEYVATLQACCGLPAPTIRSHAGRLRRDFPVDFPHLNGDVRSDYDAPGREADLPSLTLVRSQPEGGRLAKARASCILGGGMMLEQPETSRAG